MPRIRKGEDSMLTKQDMFTRMWNHFIVEKQPFAVTTSGACGMFRCQFLTSDGARCAAGLFILEEKYAPALERESIYADAVKRALEPGAVEHMDLLRSLQAAHDGSALLGEYERALPEEARQRMYEALRRVAYNYMLEVPG